MALLVNGERIETAAIEAEKMRLRRGGEPAPAENLDQQAVDNLVGQVIVRQQARQVGPSVAEDEIEAEMLRMYAEYGGQSVFFQRHGLSEEDEPRVREHVGENLRIQGLIEDVCRPVEPPAEDEVKTYFEDHRDEFVEPPQIRVSHIVKRPEGRDDSETFEQMVALRRQLTAGADFVELANENSDCSNEPGGDLGFFSRGKMVEEFETVAFSMELGEISPVFVTQFGYHIAKVVERKDERALAFDEVREPLAERLQDQRKDALFNDYLDRLRSDATVEEAADPEPAKPAAGGKGKKGKKGKKKRKSKGKKSGR